MIGSFERGANDNKKGDPADVLRFKNVIDDPSALYRFTSDALDDLNEIIKTTPELGISQQEVDEKIKYYENLAQKEGIAALEDELEKMQMTDIEATWENRAEIIRRVGLTTAYLAES